MILFLDTSALMKKYIGEAGSDVLQTELEKAEEIFVSFMSELELFASIERFKKIRRINSPEYRKMVREVEGDFERKTFQIIGITEKEVKLAKNFIQRHKLRAPDAIQLASVSLLLKTADQQVTFLCCDEKLKEAAILEGMKVFDPTKN